MHDTSPELIEAISKLARLRSVQKRAERGSEKLFREFEALGYSRGAVERVIDLMDTSAHTEHGEVVQAQSLLKGMRAPVQIEFAGIYETAVDGRRALTDLQDDGYWARLAGQSRVFKAQNEEERSAWMSGWDEADAALRGVD